jgi:general stress protein 26
MATLDMEFDGTLWFFTPLDSSKVGEVADEGQVNLNFADPAEHRYVSLSGLATLSVDRQKIEELWSADVEPWFPEGIQDSQLALLRVDIDKWEYWDARSGVMVFCEGALTEPAAEFVQEVGDHLRVDLSGIWVTQDVGNSRMRNEDI